MDSNALLDALKKRLNIPTDNALARKVLKVDPMSLKDMRERGLSDKRVVQISSLLDIDPCEPLASVHAERSKEPEVRKVWEKLAKTLRSVAATIAIVGMAATIAPGVTRADGSSHGVCILCQILRRLLERLRLGLAAFLVMVCIPAFAADPWTGGDLKREAIYLTFHALDWGQTRYVADHPESQGEANPFLDHHPTRESVDRYFLTTAVLHIAAAHILPAEIRRAFQYVTIGVEAGVVVRNRYGFNVRVSF